MLKIKDLLCWAECFVRLSTNKVERNWTKRVGKPRNPFTTRCKTTSIRNL